MKIIKKTRKPIVKNKLNFVSKKKIIEKYAVIKNRYRLVANFILPKSILKKRAETPKIKIKLAIFDPITLPTIASVAGMLFIDATMVITNSGAEVPKATMVNPMRIGERLNSLAIVSENVIILSAEYSNKRRPIIIVVKEIII